MAEERLQKIIAQAGLASRRKAETFITAGRVRVNGKLVTELGARADARSDRIEVDGKVIRVPKAWTYILLYKPEGVVTTASDEFQRKNVLDLIKGVDARLFPVGRLDLDAEGALLLTNDGQLAAGLTHPAAEVRKVYQVKLRGQVREEALQLLRDGVTLEDGDAQAMDVHRVVRATDARNTWISLTVTEGRNHLVKRMLASVGHPVVRLRRVGFGTLNLDGMRPRGWRHLRRDELRKLKAIARTGLRKRDASRARRS